MLPPISEIGKYECRGLLGRGHFGDVYEAYDTVLQVPRAIKVIEAGNPHRLIQRFHEARLQEICRHKHVVEVKDADVYEINGRRLVVIATELLPKGSVQDLLRSGFATLSESIRIICEACFGLEHLHINDVLHCDVKPGNILLTDNMTAKLSDFGLAVRIRVGEVPPNVYALHMAPEMVSVHQATVLTDVYAMGVTFYRMINNIMDLAAIAPPNVENLIQSGRFPSRNSYPAYVPKKIRRRANKAMHVDPTKRYQSPSGLRRALERISVAISWHPIGPSRWQGEQGTDRFLLFADSNRRGWYVEFMKNGRRKRARCKRGFSNNWEADAYIHQVVAETSLA